MRVKAVLFDKDGTLFDFQKSWSRWIQQEIDRLAGADPDLAHEIADAIGFDLSAGLIVPGSPAIAGTSRDVAALMLPFLPDTTLDDLSRHLDRTAAALIPVEVLPLVPFLAQLAAMDLLLGLATNDSEAAARAHLRHFGIEGMFDYIAGYDSGHGAKPDPGMCIAFALQCGVQADDIVMVGDSLHDLDAGRSAGMQTVAVLTGVASASELHDHADVVLTDIGHLADWITG